MGVKQRMTEGWSFVKRTVSLWSAKNPFQFAGALAFYTIFSLAPLLIILITVTGVIFGEDAARGEISNQIEDLIGPQAAQAVESAVRQSRPEESGILPTLIGVGALLFGATTVFAQMQTALNNIWDVVARPSRSGILLFIRTRLLSLSLVLIIGFLLLVSFVLTMTLATLLRFASQWVPVPNAVAWVTDLAISLTVVTLLFATIFKVLPDVHLSWRDMWRGAFLTAVLFTVGQYLISLYLTETAPGSPYGAAGSLVIVLMWVYYSSLILFFGAAFTRLSLERRGGAIEPKSTAVRVRTEVVEDASEETREPVPEAG